MSSFLWACVTVVLALELLILSLFVAPLPWGVRKNVTRFFQRPAVEAAFQRVLRYVGFGLALAIVESIHGLQNLHKVLQFSVDERVSVDASANMTSDVSAHDFRLESVLAQRNLYLAGFCLVLLFTLSRVIELVSHETALRDKIKQLTAELELLNTRSSKIPAVKPNATTPEKDSSVPAKDSLKNKSQ
jgi:Bap31/Bap29 transmembrane region